MQLYKRSFLLLCLAVLCNACDQYLEVEAPKTQLSSSNVFTNDQTATSALMGMYSEIMNGQEFLSGGFNSITVLSGMSSDEFSNHASEIHRIEFAENNILNTNELILEGLWQPAYKTIYYANGVLEGIKNNSVLSTTTMKQLEGEALFIRALCHFYLTNLFGDVPLVTNTDYSVNASLHRSLSEEVYQQIIEDLLRTETLLTDDYAAGDKSRPNRWAAKALLARVYLYTDNRERAESYATQLINSGVFELENDLNRVFLKSNNEAIWQLQPVAPGKNTWEAVTFIPNPDPQWVSFSNSFITAIETGDLRKQYWIGTTDYNGQPLYYPYKYKVNLSNQPLTEYSTQVRLAELYLIRAEARAKQNKLEGAIADVNTIRNRAGLSQLPFNLSESEILSAIIKERRIELFAEGGHRWFDLKRTDKVNEVLGSRKPGWQPTDALYPIPQSERENNPNLTQNSGY